MLMVKVGRFYGEEIPGKVPSIPIALLWWKQHTPQVQSQSQQDPWHLKNVALETGELVLSEVARDDHV